MLINYTTRQLAAKIVYFGPGLSGKTSNLKHIYMRTAPGSRGELISLETDSDRTLFFDLLPIEVGVIAGFQTKFQLYTVPGQVHYESTRNLVLKGVDGLVFVADSQPALRAANKESLEKLYRSLRQVDVNPDEVPMVFQFNKRDLPGVMSVEEMNAELNPKGLPYFEAAAASGAGVFETLKGITKMTLKNIKVKIASPSTQAAPPSPRPARVSTSPPPPQPEPPREPPPKPAEREAGVGLGVLRSVPEERMEKRRAPAFEQEKVPAEKTAASAQTDELFDGFFAGDSAAKEPEWKPPESGDKGTKGAEPLADDASLAASDDVAFAELDADAVLEEEFAPQVDEDYTTVHFDRAAPPAKAKELDPDLAIPVKRVAVESPTDVQKTLEQLVQMTVSSMLRERPKALATDVGDDQTIESRFKISAPLADFSGTRFLRFDVTFDGERPVRVKDAFVVGLGDVEDARRLTLTIHLEVKAKK